MWAILALLLAVLALFLSGGIEVKTSTSVKIAGKKLWKREEEEETK